MSSFTKQFSDEEMNTALEELLTPGEHLETAVYCIFKATGFWESNSRVIMGYAGVTDKQRLLCCKFHYINDETAVYDMNKLIKLKIKPIILNQIIITAVFDNNGKKQTVKLQLAPKVAGGKLPNQERNTEKMLEIFETAQNMLA